MSRQDPVLFKLKTIIGTTATSHANFSLVGNTIAYTAGAGAVVACLQKSDNQDDEMITGHRFFCTSSRTVQAIQHSHNTLSSSWLSDLQGNNNNSSSSNGGLSRDSHGYLIPPSQYLYSSSILAHGGGKNGNGNTIGSGGAATPAAGGASSINYDDGLSGSATTNAKLKMKTTTAVALSHDGKLLAIGETGHLPRVFIYSTAPDASTSVPLAILSEHRFGIKALSFSPCGRFLASLGTSNDGFLHVWYLSLREGVVQLHSSNRCISYVHDMKWLDSSRLLTIGVRHVRVWKVEQNRPQSPDVKANVLTGRNVVLSEFSTSTFVAMAILSDNMAILATNKGELGTLHDNSNNIGIEDEDKPLVFTSRMTTGFDLSTIDVDIDNKVVWVAGANDNIKKIALQHILSAEPLKSSIPSTASPLKLKNLNSITLAVAAWEKSKVVALTGGKDISVLTVDKDDENNVPIPQEKLLSCHAPEMRGIRPVTNPNADNQKTRKTFLTWTADGGVRIWDNRGNPLYQMEVKLDLTESEELTTVCQDSTENSLIIGTSFGQVQIINLLPKDADGEKRVTSSFNAHGSSVLWIDYYYNPDDHDDNKEFFASCSRDRTIQVFVRTQNTGEWKLNQTLTAHKGNIFKVQFSQDGKRLISCSADRTLHIHKFAVNESTGMFGFLSEKIISLKSGPSDMEIEYESGNIVLSCDKHILSYKVPTGELLSSFRTMDQTFEAVNLSTISIKRIKGKTFLAGMGSDKGIRVYEYPTGQFIGSAWGHSEGISGISWIDGETNEESIVISSGNDGCIFLWDIQPYPPIENNNNNTNTNNLSVASPNNNINRISPTRKILSKSELTQYSQQQQQQQQRLSPGTPTPTNKQLQQQKLSASSLAKPSPTRRITPSKSLSELRPRKEEPIPTKSPRESYSTTSSLASPSRKSGNNNIDDICTELTKFRESYKKTTTPYDQTKVEKLKQELRQTIRLLDGTINERMKVDELMEIFGERLTTIVSKKISS